MTSPEPPAVPAGAAIDRVELFHVSVPLLAPFEASHGTESTRQVVVVRVVAADGTVGHGECDALTKPTYTHEYAAGAFRLLRDEVVPALLAGRPVPDRWHPMARAALGTAQLDAVLRRRGVRLADELAVAVGGRARPSVARTVVLGRAATIDGLLASLTRAVAGGAELVKLKLGSLDDLAAFGVVRRQLPAVALAADANGALAGIEPRAVVAAGLDELGLRYLEQPYPADDLLAAAALRRLSATPLCLDESIGSRADAEVALALGALDVINVKPARLGGLVEAAELARWAVGEGLDCFCGGMLELGIGRAAAAAFASLDACRLPTDLGPSDAYVAQDLTDPVGTDAEGRLVVPVGAGIGAAPHQHRLAAATLAAAHLDRPA